MVRHHGYPLERLILIITFTKPSDSVLAACSRAVMASVVPTHPSAWAAAIRPGSSGQTGSRSNAVIHVYCIMDNHYHLLLETPSGNLSKIMAYINGAYTTYFNTKRQRCGHLFQGRFKAILVEAVEYAKELSRYIHLNPARAKMTELPEDYKWSSYSFYIGKDKSPEWLTVDFIFIYFGKKISDAQSRYMDFVNKKIGQEYESPQY
jgi:REP element-mobilizing transposase RayT